MAILFQHFLLFLPHFRQNIQPWSRIEKGKLGVECECAEECTYNLYSISQQQNVMLERSSPRLHDDTGDTKYGHFGTDVLDGLNFDSSYWFNMGIDLHQLTPLQQYQF